MRSIALIVFLFLISSCVQPKYYSENVFPYRNYTENHSPFVPINLLNMDTVYRIWFFESTSLDRLIVITNHEKTKFQAELVEFGFVQNKKQIKEVFRLKAITGKDSLSKFIEYLDVISKNDSISVDTTEIAYDQPIKHFFLERKINKTIETIVLHPESKTLKLIKDQFNLNY